MTGFLGTRGDFLSDLLMIALALIVPALTAGVYLAAKKAVRPHKFIMLTIFSVLVAYVVVYETNLTLLGGMGYLFSKTSLGKTAYSGFAGGHVAVGLLALILGALAIRRGQALVKAEHVRGASRQDLGPLHRRMAWTVLIVLGITVLSGISLYYFTFVY